MAVSLVVIAAVAVIIVLFLLLILCKLLQKRKKVDKNATGQQPASKDGYEKLENAETGQGGVGDGVDSNITPGAKGKKGKRKKKRKTKSGASDGITGVEGELQGNSVTSGLTQESSNPRLQLSVLYSNTRRQLLVTIHQGQNIAFGSAAITQIRLTALPLKTQRFKTKCVPSTNPIFEQFFAFDKVDSEDGVLRVRAYKVNCNRKILIGELRVDVAAELSIAETDTGGKSIDCEWRELTLAQDITEVISDDENITDPESVLAAPKRNIAMMLISLHHKAVSGKLTVEIIKARNVKVPVTQKAPEAFVEVSLHNSHGGEVANARTAISKGTYHPTFEETFYFPAIEYELEGFTVVISMFNKKFRRNDLLGTFSIGRDSTGEREKLHWELVNEAPSEPVQGWYLLTPP